MMFYCTFAGDNFAMALDDLGEAHARRKGVCLALTIYSWSAHKSRRSSDSSALILGIV